MPRETLCCEFDGHFWTRESARGRKPQRCPKHPKSMITKDGTVLTPQLEQELVEEAEVVGYVDVEPVTLRSTKTSKEAPGSPQEPFTPRLVTRGKGRGGKPSSEPLAGQNGQNSLTPVPEIPGPEADKITGLQTLYCENGDHEWTREAARGRKPTNCKIHPNPARDRDTDAAAKRKKAERRVMLLEEALTINGSHISQHR